MGILEGFPDPWVFLDSTVLASKVFKEASSGARRVVVVGEQAAGSPTFSTAPAWAWTLQSEEGMRHGECEPDPWAPHSQPFLVPWGRGYSRALTG